MDKRCAFANILTAPSSGSRCALFQSSRRSFQVIERALRATSLRADARIVHFSVQGNHMHMLVEAADRRALSSAMRSLAIRIGLGMNRLMGSSGRVIAHRYHARALRSPTEVYRALGYVRHNRDVHAARRGGAQRRANLRDFLDF